jgi:CDP-diacylglycerol---glycerol-3-phosphate 3-phosphatidyltransferase
LIYSCSREGQDLSIYALKPRFQALLRPLVGMLYRAGVTANQVTIAACVVSVLLGASLLWSPASAAFALVPLWLFIRMGLNAVDGMLAREFGQASRLGAYLNELGDVIADAALYLPFALLPGSSPWLVWTVVALAIVSEMAGALGLALGGARRYDGPMGKSDRAFVFGAAGLAVALGVPMAAVFDWLWGAVIVLLVATIFNRVRRGCAA